MINKVIRVFNFVKKVAKGTCFWLKLPPDKGKNKGRQNTDTDALPPLPDNYKSQTAPATIRLPNYPVKEEVFLHSSHEERMRRGSQSSL